VTYSLSTEVQAEEDAELFASAQLHDGLVHVALSNLDTAMALLTKAATASGEGETFVQAETCRSVAAMQSGHLTQGHPFTARS